MLAYSLSLLCIAAIISVCNQDFEFDFFLTFLSTTEAFAFIDLFIKSNIQNLHGYISSSVEEESSSIFCESFLLCDVSIIGRVSRYAYEISFFIAFLVQDIKP